MHRYEVMWCEVMWCDVMRNDEECNDVVYSDETCTVYVLIRVSCSDGM